MRLRGTIERQPNGSNKLTFRRDGFVVEKYITTHDAEFDLSRPNHKYAVMRMAKEADRDIAFFHQAERADNWREHCEFEFGKFWAWEDRIGEIFNA